MDPVVALICHDMLTERRVGKARMATREDDEVFSALADPTRRAILQFIRSSDEPTAGEIADFFPDLGRTAVSSHLRLLRLAHLVEERRDGRYRRYSLGPVRLEAVVRFLAGVYADSLETLQEAVARAELDSDGVGRSEAG